MRRDLRDLLKDAEQLGFQPERFDGRGHLRLHSAETGHRYSVSASPSDWRSRKNEISTLERLSGRRLPQAKAGKHRHNSRRPRLDTTLSAAEKAASEQVDALLVEADSLRQRFTELVAESSRSAVAEARAVLERYERIRRQLVQSHRIIGPLGIDGGAA